MRQERDAPVFADLVNGDDILVLDRRRRAGLRRKSLGAVGHSASLWFHDLQRHPPLQSGVFRLEDDAHAAGAEDLHDAVRPEPADFIRQLRRGQKRIFAAADRRLR